MTRLRMVSVLSILAAAFVLQGCASLFGIHRFAAVSRDKTAEAPQVADANTQRGRQLLDEVRIADAIDAFRAALAGNERVAPAINGLGVAYAMLGRDDLARRYFSEAASLDPSDSRFAANLQRLDQKQLSAPAALADAGNAAATADADRASPAAAAPNAGNETGRLRRVSAFEVRVDTMPARSRPAFRPAQRLLASTGSAIEVAVLDTAPVAPSPAAKPAAASSPAAKPSDAVFTTPSYMTPWSPAAASKAR